MSPIDHPTTVFDADLSAQVARQVRARYRRCWTNAACSVRLLGDRGQYVEGWVVVNRFHPIVIEHGWCEVENRIVDPTYTPSISNVEPPLAYFCGSRFSTIEAEIAIERGKLPIAWLRNDVEYTRAFYRAWSEAGRRLRHEPRPKTRVVHCRKGPSDVFIGRPSIWANPYHIGPDGTREQVMLKYREWVIRQPRLMREIRSLRGKTLGCACAPLPCHGDVLADLADLGCTLIEPAGKQSQETLAL